MEFKIVNLERNTADDVVSTVHYTVSKTDNEFVGSSYGSIGLEKGDSFIPFESLTEATVVEWVKDKLDVETLESSLDAQIEAQKNPVQVSGLPW
jgi:hypothetical protein